MQWLVAGYGVLAILAVSFAALLTLQTWEHRRFSRSRTRHPSREPPRGRIALLVPCKGADVDLESNLRPLFEQDHENYEMIFVVEKFSGRGLAHDSPPHFAVSGPSSEAD